MVRVIECKVPATSADELLRKGSQATTRTDTSILLRTRNSEFRHIELCFDC